MKATLPTRLRSGHTLVELVVAMACSAVLLTGLGSVMLIARQIAYAPSASTARIEAAAVINRLSDELHFATMILEQSDHAIEFVVADRNNPPDGRAERIRYEWSGTPGDPLERTMNGQVATTVIDGVHDFQVVTSVDSKTETLATTIESAEGQLLGTSLGSTPTTGITADYWLARRIDPSQFPASVGGINKSAATSWNATRARFYGRNVINPSVGTVFVQLRAIGDPYDGPTSHVLGQVTIPETSITSSADWNTAQFATPVRGLALGRKYSLVWEGDLNVAGNHAQLVTASSTAGNVTNSTDHGASWASEPLEVRFQLFGCYVAPGPSYNVTRRFVTHARFELQADDATHSRIGVSTSLANRPELVSAKWRADFESNPTTVDLDGDGTFDWVKTSGSFNVGTLNGGVWTVDGPLETRPLNDFAAVTYIDACCRNGAVLRINADRQGGTHGPLIVRVTAASGSQTLSLSGETATNEEKNLASVERLSSGWTRVRLLIVPQQNVVRLQVQDRVVGTFVYPTYATSTTNRFISLSGTGAQFDYVEAGVLGDAVVQ